MLSVANFSNLNLNLNLRVFKTENESIYLHGADLGKKLGYTNPQKAVRDHVSDKNKVRFSDLQGGEQNVHALKNQQPHEIMLTEAGAYELLFGSKLPIAKKFREWMFEQVIPSIRRTGAYYTPSALPKFKEISDDDFKLTMDNEQEMIEMRKEMDEKRDLIKDKKMATLGKIGGQKTQQRRRDIKIKIEEQKEDIKCLEDDLESLEEENERLFEDNETMSNEITRLTFDESGSHRRIQRLENEIDCLRNLARDQAVTIVYQTELIEKMETKINGAPENVELPKPNEEGL